MSSYVQYEADFIGFGSDLVGRQELAGPANLQNNIASELDLSAGSTNQYQFAVSGSPEAAWVTVNICSQPQPDSTSSGVAPMLTLYVSTTDLNQRPGPGVSGQEEVVVTNGFATYRATNPQNSILFALHAPDLPTGVTGDWIVQAAASTDQAYHTTEYGDDFYYLVDADAHGALFISNNLTDTNATDDETFRRIMDSPPPYTMFVLPQDSNAVRGIEHSYCAMTAASRPPDLTVQTGMTTRGADHRAKQQIFVEGLNASTTYTAYWARTNASTTSSPSSGIIGGGGAVWPPQQFTTKSSTSCKLIFNLTFCNEIAYSVPSNPTFNTTSLAELYDNNSRDLYKGFNYSLQQIPCNTTSTAQYSLARTCDDCANDYKDWLCLVNIPRCADFDDPSSYLQPRNTSNSTRSTVVKEVIQPGPHKELLPCEDYCYGLIRSCPAKLGFSCPVAGKGLEKSYGRWERSSDELTCSYLGAPIRRDSAGKARVSLALVVGMAVFGAMTHVLY